MKCFITLIIAFLTAQIIFLFPPFVSLLLVPISIFAFLIFSNIRNSLFLFVVLYSIPMCVGKYLGKELPVVYLFAPVIVVLLLIQKISKRESLNFAKFSLNPFWILMIAYFAVILGNFLRQPVFLGNIAELGQRSFGIHSWMRYFLSFCYYLVFAEFVSTDIEFSKKLMNFIFWLCVFLSIFGILLVYLIPMQNIVYKFQSLGVISPGFFATGGVDLLETRYRDASGGYHIGGLSLFASVGLFCMLSKVTIIRQNFLKNLLLLLFIFAIILSGMRSFFLGAVLAIFAWLIINKKPKYIFIGIIVSISFYFCAFVFYENLPYIFQRTFRVQKGFEALDSGRFEVFSFYLKSFLNKPFFGTGLGTSGYAYSSNWLSFFKNEQLRTGGHNTYLSLLYLFGLAGFIPFFIAFMKSFLLSFKLMLEADDGFIKSLGLFCFLYFVFNATIMLFSGNGGDPFYFAVLGILSGVIINLSRKREAKK